MSFRPNVHFGKRQFWKIGFQENVHLANCTFWQVTLQENRFSEKCSFGQMYILESVRSGKCFSSKCFLVKCFIGRCKHFQTYFAYFLLLQAFWQLFCLIIGYCFNAARLEPKLMSRNGVISTIVLLMT